MNQHTNREAWLTAAIAELAPMFRDAAGVDVPTVRVSVGWPGGGGNKSATIGQCWASFMAEDKTPQIFISPVLNDAARVLDVLAHELVHAVDDCKSGHRGEFRRIALAVGLRGKMTATVAGDELRETLTALAEKLGAYPHAALSRTGAAPRKPEGEPGEPGEPEDRPKLGEPKQTTRMIKLEAACCGYTVRTTRKWIAVGLPSCPCGAEMIEG